MDAVFLFTKTNAGFDGIPSTYRFRDLDILPSIIDTQLKVKKHNMKAKKKDKIKSNIIIILDDMVGSGGMSADMRSNKLLNKLATNGRHLSDGDNSNMMVILISQIFTGIGPQIRLNTDFLFTTKLQARRERENIVNSFLSLNSGRKALAESYDVFDSIVNKEDFNFDLIPIVPKKEELKLLSLDEILAMNNSQRSNYDEHLKRMFESDEKNIKLYEDHMEIEASYKEQEYSTESDMDDY